MSVFSKLYRGETQFDVIGRAKVWLAISVTVVLVSLLSLFVRELNLGIDFEGGAVWEFPAGTTDVQSARNVAEREGITDAKVQELASAELGTRIRVQGASLGLEREEEIVSVFAEEAGVEAGEVSLTSVGPSWGDEISEKAVRALVFFLIAITIYVTFRFEFKMAIAVLAALLHDIVVTVGVYSVAGFQVTPATVIAFLTILGYSVYDGIVVFDKVDENSRLVSVTGRMSYSSMVNLSVNQTLMRSLNTTITTLLPTLSLLIVGSYILGATTLQEFALVLVVGLASGAYSSLFIASPLLAVLKEREPRFRDIRNRIDARGERGPIEPAPATVSSAPRPAPAPAGESGSPMRQPSGAIPPRPRKKTRRR